MIAQGIIHATVASVNAANTTASTLLYQYSIPAALLAGCVFVLSPAFVRSELKLNSTWQQIPVLLFGLGAIALAKNAPHPHAASPRSRSRGAVRYPDR